MGKTMTIARAIGIQTVAPAAVFAALYVPLLAFFVFQAIRRPTYVYTVLSVFCTIRITAFIIRAILAGNVTDADNLGLVIADQILFGVGFFGLLYSAYTLVLDRELLTNVSPRKGPLSQIIYNRRIFRMIMMVGVVLGIVASTEMSSGDASTTSGTAHSLRIASTVIFLVLTILVAYQTLILASAELQDYSPLETGLGASKPQPIGKRHGAYILLVIALLLIVREAFNTATLNSPERAYQEKLWYPLYALPELIAVAFYTTPGLVPARSELQARGEVPGF